MEASRVTWKEVGGRTDDPAHRWLTQATAALLESVTESGDRATCKVEAEWEIPALASASKRANCEPIMTGADGRFASVPGL